ncbi:MAG TPA: hypothetical protein VHC86_00835 [Opitutaceae bacterium]|nr:hypothetical protein [Opitutaceae bacterium]
MSHTEGFVYVATGPHYRAEAARSAASLRTAHPGARICLVAEAAEGPKFWDDFVLLQKPAFGFRDKIAMRRCPYDRFCFLDCDTQVIGDLADVFRLLDHFDFAGHQLFEGHDCPVPGLPDAFPEFNTGILAFRRSPVTEALFDRWLELYDKFSTLLQGGDFHYSNISDQKSLRLALYESSVRLTVLGPEYNFVPQQVEFACAPVRVLHGRGPLSALAARINRRLINRVYVPRFDAILSDEMDTSELRRLWTMSTFQLLRNAGVALTPERLRGALRRSPLVRRIFLRNDFDTPPAHASASWRRPPAP